MLKQGKTSTEFMVVAYLLSIWSIKYLGIDIGQALNILMGMSQDSLVAIKQLGHDPSSVPEWAGVAYIVGRKALKAYAMRNGMVTGGNDKDDINSLSGRL